MSHQASQLDRAYAFAKKATPAGASLPGRVERWLEEAGIRVNGSNPWDMQVHDARLALRVAREGLSDGLGDSYVDGWWDCDALDEAVARVLRRGLLREGRFGLSAAGAFIADRVFNRQSRAAARRDISRHYDLGNDLFAAMLDPLMVYSCGYWIGARSLAEAQEAKLNLVCRKLGIGAGMRVLDIGCGWGGLCRFAAERYGARVLGVTLSGEQAAYAQEVCGGLDVEVRLADYRDVSERFDRVVSLGMLEHVGPRNYREYMGVVCRCLKEEGLALVHTIGSSQADGALQSLQNTWMRRHIFPGAAIPSMAQLVRSMDGLLVIEDVQNIGANYDPTLMAWAANFREHWPQLALKYGERFRRMWRYYLLSCAGAFRARSIQVWQFVLSPRGVAGGYVPVR